MPGTSGLFPIWKEPEALYGTREPGRTSMGVWNAVIF